MDENNVVAAGPDKTAGNSGFWIHRKALGPVKMRKVALLLLMLLPAFLLAGVVSIIYIGWNPGMVGALFGAPLLIVAIVEFAIWSSIRNDELYTFIAMYILQDRKLKELDLVEFISGYCGRKGWQFKPIDEEKTKTFDIAAPRMKIIYILGDAGVYAFMIKDIYGADAGSVKEFVEQSTAHFGFKKGENYQYGLEQLSRENPF